MINFKTIGHTLGAIWCLLALLLGIVSIVGLIISDPAASGIGLSSLITLISGAAMWFFCRDSEREIHKREGYLVVSLGWLTVGLFSALPYWMTIDNLPVIDAIFESISGLTTTGATIYTDIESLPHTILLWRSITQWIGGMGIIVLTVAIFPLLGIGGVELFVAESPGPTSNKIHPRIKETAKRLWLIYVSLTVVLIAILKIEGMSIFDAINHGMTTIATGGFSTKNASLGHWDVPMIHYTVLIFMFIAGINYTLIYYSLKGKFRKVWSSDEFKTYLIATFLLILGITISIHNYGQESWESSFRDASFQIVSIITTTGFVTADYTAWHASITILFFTLLFAGACAGSTSGGIKFIRHLVFAKNSALEFKRLLHPNSLIRLKIDQKIVAPRILTHVLVFLLIYLLFFLVGSIVMTSILSDWEQPLLTGVGSVATTLGNVGPAIGQVGPMDNFAAIPPLGKGVLCFLMLIGRLELFSILILFTPYFWRST